MNPRHRGEDRRISRRFAALGTLPPAEPFAIEILIHPRKIEVRPVDLDSAPYRADESPRTFHGPIAGLKRFASERSKPGFRIYAQQLRNKRSTSIKVHVRRDDRCWSRTFSSEADARNYIESLEGKSTNEQNAE